MKKNSFFLLFFFWNMTSAQQPGFDKVTFDAEKLYMIARGTKSKQGIISKNFNSADTNITHIGLAYYELPARKLKIYNISTEKKLKNALVVESIEDFVSPKDLFYVGIWECSLKKSQFLKAKKVLAGYERRFITFDYDFDLHNADSSLYCSEFCWNILSAVSQSHFSYKPQTKLVTNSFFKNVIGRDTLTYVPVDFFMSFSRFKKLKEIKTK